MLEHQQLTGAEWCFDATYGSNVRMREILSDTNNGLLASLFSPASRYQWKNSVDANSKKKKTLVWE